MACFYIIDRLQSWYKNSNIAIEIYQIGDLVMARYKASDILHIKFLSFEMSIKISIFSCDCQNDMVLL